METIYKEDQAGETVAVVASRDIIPHVAPNFGYMLVKMDGGDEMTDAGIVVTGSMAGKYGGCEPATVVAVADGTWDAATREREPVEFDPGERVLVKPGSGQDVGNHCKMLRTTSFMSDVLGRIE